MAVSPKVLEQVHAEIVHFPIVQCGCGCGMINTLEHEYIYSKATGCYYADMVCFTDTVADYYNPQDRRVKFMGHWMSVSEFMKEMEANWNGESGIA